MVTIAVTQIDLIPSADVEAGEVFCGATDSPLTSAGLKALKRVVRRKKGWSAVVSSPLQRCRQFAAWVAERHGLPVHESRAFAELDFGDWEGLLPHAIMLDHPQDLTLWWADPTQFTPPGGEPYPHFRKRVLQGWQLLLRKHKGQQVLLICHPMVLRVLLAEVMQVPSYRLFTIHVEHGTLSTLRVVHDEGGDWCSLMAHGDMG